MVSVKTPLRFLEAVFLDVISIPGNFMCNEKNARYHLKYVCPKCSNHRKKFRDLDFDSEKGKCIWEEEWFKGNWDFSRNYGLGNWVRYYFGLKTNLEEYENKRRNSEQ